VETKNRFVLYRLYITPTGSSCREQDNPVARQAGEQAVKADDQQGEGRQGDRENTRG